MTRNERKIIGVVIWFANAKLTSTKQVEKRFRAAVEMGEDEFKGVLSTDLKSFQTVDQPRARRYLQRVIDFDKSPAEKGEDGQRRPNASQLEFSQEIQQFLGRNIWASPRFGKDRNGLRIDWETHVDGVEACIAYACALLIANAKLRRRVGLCAYPTKRIAPPCTKFFLDTRERGGLPQVYCSLKHSDADRSARSRANPKHK